MADYISSYTGEEVDSAVEKAISLPATANNQIVANQVLYYNGDQIAGLSLNGGIFPSYDDTGDTDEGKVLTIDEYGTLDWEIPSSGGSGAGDGLPDTSNANIGDILLITGDCYSDDKEASWESLDNILHYNGASEGDVLTYDGNSLSWNSISIEGVPDYSSASEGDVLTYDGNSLSWNSIDIEGVPDYSSASEGDVLTYDGYGNIGWSSLPTPNINDLLPDTTYANNGDALIYNDNSVEWATLIPSYSYASEGQVLTIDYEGELSWAYPLPAYDTESSLTAGTKYILTVQDGYLAWEQTSQ